MATPDPPESGDFDDQSPGTFTRLGTLGVEEELIVVDAAGRPAAGAHGLVHEGDPPPALAGRLDHEMYECIVETETPVCDGVDEVRREVSRVRDALVRYADRRGYGVAAAGLHPLACPGVVDVVDEQRYASMLERLRYPQWRNVTTGLHVHVGVDDPDKAVWIADKIRWHLPVMLALSANSPFYDGTDTGLASARANLFEGLPQTGIPPAFDSYAEYARFAETMVETGSVADAGQLWWDVRPHAEHGTVEIRSPDAQCDVASVAAFAEYARALVVDLAARYEDGESVPCPRRAFLQQNKWRALRRGHDAAFVDREGADEVDLEAVVDRECDRLGITGIREVLARESGAARQRRRHREGGMDAVCAGLRLRADERAASGPRDDGRQHPVRGGAGATGHGRSRNRRRRPR